MAPRLPPKRATSVSTGSKKKDMEKVGSVTSQKMVTHRTTVLDALSDKEKEKCVSDKVLENNEQATEGMETEEEGDNWGVFSTPKRGNSPAQQQMEPQVTAPSLSTFPTPPNLPAQPIFVLPARAPEAPPLSQHLKLNLKRPADPLGGSPIRKTARADLRRSDMDQRIIDILGVVQGLVKTVEKQTVEIQELKRLVQEAKGDHVKAAQNSPRKISTMASHIAANIANGTVSPGNVHKAAQKIPAQSDQSKGGPSIAIDLSACDVGVKERTFLELRSHIQKSFQRFDETQGLVLKGMNKDGKKDHRFFLFFHTEDDEKKARIHAGNWLSTAFPRGNIQSLATYKVKVNNVRADAVIDVNTNRITEAARQALSDSSGYSIARIGWLSGPGKRYGSM